MWVARESGEQVMIACSPQAEKTLIFRENYYAANTMDSSKIFDRTHCDAERNQFSKS